MIWSVVFADIVSRAPRYVLNYWNGRYCRESKASLNHSPSGYSHCANLPKMVAMGSRP